MPKNMTELLKSTTLTPMRMTPVERSLGRFMRAPDGHEGGDPGAGGEGAAAAAEGAAAADGSAAAAGGEGAQGAQGAGDEGAQGADNGTTLMGGAGTKDTSGEGEGSGEQGEKPAAAPDSYELKITTTAPGEDGQPVETEVELDSALVEAATPIFKEVGLTNEQANKLAPLAVKVQERMAEQMADNHQAQVAEWGKQAKDDPEIGGRNWSTTETNVARALDHFVGPAVTKDEAGNETRNGFRQLLDDSGLGNHPELIRAFNKIGAALGEDSNLLRGDAGAQITKSREEVMYPNMAGSSASDRGEK